jgi:hypothetical protein
MLEVNSGSLKLYFAESLGNGLPEQIWLVDDDGIETEIIGKNGYSLQVELEDGKTLKPCLNKGHKLKCYSRNGAQYVECSRLDWTDENGRGIPDFAASIKHEFQADGTAFADVFFSVEDRTPPAIKNFELKIKLELAAFDNVKWGMFYRPQAADGTLIQTSAPSRFLNRGSDKTLETGIFPLASFNTVDHGSPQLYLEFFMEGGNSISGLPEDNKSSIVWEDGNPVLTWNFQKKLCRHRNMPWQ